jgi:molybdopterin-guanine dinucleotide biosynthesis protein A
MSDAESSRATLAVIAGGAGSRMGGPKHSLTLDGQPILERLMDRLEWQGPSILVLGAAGSIEIPGSDRFSRIVRDEVPGEGPLGGILASLDACETDVLIAVPIDMPGLAVAHLRWLIDRAADQACSCLLLRRSAGIEPFPLLLDRSAAPLIRSAMAAGTRAVRDLAALPAAVVVEAPQSWAERTWDNLNTPADLAEFRAASDTMSCSIPSTAGDP